MSADSGPARVAVITGAAGGIGSALARRYVRAGFRVALLDRDAAGVAGLAAELGEHAVGFGCDVTSYDECRRAMLDVQAEMGGIDVLLNNAGITHLSRFADTDPAVLRRVMDVNFFGAVICTHAALPALRERRGTVVVLSSVAGFAPLAGRAGYAASKHALQGLFASIRAELAPLGVGVTIVCPAFVDTQIGASALGGDGGPAHETRTTTGRALSPEAVADAIHAGVARGRPLVLIGGLARISHAVWRLAPRLYERLMARRLLAEPKGAPAQRE